MDSLVAGVVIFFGIWLAILSYFYFKSVRHYQKLTVNDEKSLEGAINTIFRGLDELHKMSLSNFDKIDLLEKANVRNIQKIKLKRFNPFGDTGGDQSFTMVLLDDNNDGVVLSSLHGRSGTRVYAKSVKSGKQVEHELSDEEREILKEVSSR